MKNRYITWEIILAGLTFTFLAFYVLQEDSGSMHSPTHPSVSESVPASPKSPADPGPKSEEEEPAVLHLEPEDFKSLEKLKQLKNVDNLAELKEKLQTLKSVFEEEELQQMMEQFDQNLKQLKNSEIQVQFRNRESITIQKKYDTPPGEWTRVKSDKYVYRSNLNTEHLNSLNFSLSSGAFNIAGGNSSSPHLSLRTSGDIESTEKLSQRVVLQMTENNGQTTIEVNNRGNSGFFNNLNVEATLFIPSDTRVTATTNGGHIGASDLSNRTTLSTNGGHVTLNKVFGSTEVQTKGGHITVDNSGGTIKAQTAGGHVEVNDFNGDLTASTSGGHLYFRDIKGRVSGSTSGGNIKATLDSLGGDSKLSTSAGNINLKLPLNTHAKIKLKGMSTDIDDAFNFSGNTSRGTVDGIIEPADSTYRRATVPQLQATCNFGNVNLSVYEE